MKGINNKQGMVACVDSYYRDVTACHLLYNDHSFPTRVSFRARCGTRNS